MDILLPSTETQQRFLALLPPRYANAVQIVIRDFPALYESHAAQVASLAAPYDDLASDAPGDPAFSDILRRGKGKGRKGRKKGRKHRKPAPPSPAPPQPPTEPAPRPPPPPVGSNRTTPDIYNTTDLTTLFHDAYHPLSVLYDFMDELEVTYGSGAWEGAVRVFNLGTSAEGREIRGIKLHRAREGLRVQPEEKGRKVRGKGRKATASASASASAGEPAEEKMQEIYMQGGQHAREVRPSSRILIPTLEKLTDANGQWVSPATILYFTHHLLVSAFIDNNTHALDLLDRYEFTVVPTINPDGYVYVRRPFCGSLGIELIDMRGIAESRAFTAMAQEQAGFKLRKLPWCVDRPLFACSIVSPLIAAQEST